MSRLRSVFLVGMLVAALPILDLYHGLLHAVWAARGDDQSDCLICDYLATRSLELPLLVKPERPDHLETTLPDLKPRDPARKRPPVRDARSPPGLPA